MMRRVCDEFLLLTRLNRGIEGGEYRSVSFLYFLETQLVYFWAIGTPLFWGMESSLLGVRVVYCRGSCRCFRP
jgi:hypothetical protein